MPCGPPVNLRLQHILKKFGGSSNLTNEVSINKTEEPQLLPTRACNFLTSATRTLQAAEARRRYIDSLGLEEDAFGSLRHGITGRAN